MTEQEKTGLIIRFAELSAKALTRAKLTVEERDEKDCIKHRLNLAGYDDGYIIVEAAKIVK